MKARCSLFWSNQRVVLDRLGNCCASSSRSKASRESGSQRISSNPIPSPFVRKGCLRFTIKDYERTIEPKTHTSPFDAASESVSGSSLRGQLSAICRSMMPSTTLSTSNVTFCRAASSNSFALTRFPFGSRSGSAPVPYPRHRTRAAAPVNVSKPLHCIAVQR